MIVLWTHLKMIANFDESGLPTHQVVDGRHWPSSHRIDAEIESAMKFVLVRREGLARGAPHEHTMGST